MGNELAELKKEVFYRLMNLGGRVFIMVRYSDAVKIGRRGFTQEEKEGGLVLVFNSGMKFIWDSTGIHATLVFSAIPEKCYIPPENIIAISSPELKIQFTAEPLEDEEVKEGEDALWLREYPGEKDEAGEAGKVIKVDFTKKESDTPA